MSYLLLLLKVTFLPITFTCTQVL